MNEILDNKDILELRKKILHIQKNRQKRKEPDLHFLLLAASLLLLMGIEVLLFTNNNHRNPSGDNILHPKHQSGTRQLTISKKGDQPVIAAKTVNREKRIKDQKTQMKLAASFRENPSFENMTGATRHAGYFRMVLPLTGYPYSEKAEIRFEWILDEHTEIELKIMDNTGTHVHESGNLSKNKYSLPPGTLKKGLYYFKIMQNDEILFFGKFFVK